MAEIAEFTAQEVAAHKSADDVWMVINEKVYNVSKYMEDHPGGPEVLLEAAGTDATEAFDNAGHSEDAFEIMEEYCVGNLKHVGKKAAPKAVRIVATNVEKATASVRPRSSGKLVWLTLLSIGGVAASYAAHKYMPNNLSRATFKFPGAGAGLGGMGFLQGLLLGAGILTLVDTFLVHKLLGMIRKNESFLRYPPHIKVPKSIESDVLLRRGWLDPVTYYPLPLIKKSLLSPNVYRLSFALPSKEAILGLPIGQHISIKAEIDGETVTRSYTPVSNNSDKGVVDLVIKVYPDGKLTNYLAKLEIGDEVLARGPKGAMKYSLGLCKKIGMLAGGTGITPMFQLIRAICENDRDTTEISLIYANRTEQDILLREQLENYARRYPKNLKVHYLLDNPPADWKFGSGFVTQDTMKEHFPQPSDDTKVMLCGPPGMINAAKKSLANLGYKQPSAMSKLSDQVFLF